MHKYFLILFCTLTAVFYAGCEDNEMNHTFNFIGDSIITRWDVQQSFPVLITKNYGCSGSGVEYLESCSALCKSGDYAVVISGTNDSRINPENTIEDYATRYVDALLRFGAEKVYVFSILPRNFHNNGELQENRVIKALNKAILAEIESRDNPSLVYLDVYSEFIGKDGTLNMNLTYDGLHLNPEGYEILTDALNKVIF